MPKIVCKVKEKTKFYFALAKCREKTKLTGNSPSEPDGVKEDVFNMFHHWKVANK